MATACSASALGRAAAACTARRIYADVHFMVSKGFNGIGLWFLGAQGGRLLLRELLGDLQPHVAAALVVGHLHARKAVRHRAKVPAAVRVPALHLLHRTSPMTLAWTYNTGAHASALHLLHALPYSLVTAKTTLAAGFCGHK